MNHPALKGEVSITKKMQSQINPRLRRIDIVSNSLAGCVSDAAEEFSRTPKMSFSEIVLQPRMLLQQTKSAIAFEQLKSLADTHSSWHFNKQMDVVNSDVKFVDFTALPVSNLPDEELTIHSDAIELHRIHGIFAFPQHSSNYIRLFNSGGLGSNPSLANHSEILNFEDGDSSIGLKAEVSSP